MIEARFYQDHSGVIRAFEISGHSGYAEAGKDIVCAGMSMLAISLIGTLDEIIPNRFQYEVREDGYARCELDKFESYSAEEKIQAATVMKTAYIGTVQAVDSYAKYIRMEMRDYLGGKEND